MFLHFKGLENVPMIYLCVIVKVVAALNFVSTASKTAASIEWEREEVASSKIKIFVSPGKVAGHFGLLSA